MDAEDRIPLGMRGRCRTCGYLSRHATQNDRPLPTPTFYESEDTQRETGDAFKHVPHPFVGEVFTEPACFVGAIAGYTDLLAPYVEQGESRENAARHDFLEDRGCKEWIAYTPGRSPKDHFYWNAMLRLEEQCRAFEQQIERDRRDFEERLAADMKAFQERLDEKNERAEEQRHRDNKTLQQR